MLQVAELGILLHIAENAVSISTITSSHVAYHLSHMLERARGVILELQDFIRLQLLKDPDSFSDETRTLEIRWNVWLLKESKVRETAANMSAARQKILLPELATPLNGVFVIWLEPIDWLYRFTEDSEEHLVKIYSFYACVVR